jgi:hypothetical protein
MLILRRSIARPRRGIGDSPERAAGAVADTARWSVRFFDKQAVRNLPPGLSSQEPRRDRTGHAENPCDIEGEALPERAATGGPAPL